MSKGSSGQHGGLCLRGHQERILGCPRDPPGSMGPVYEGTPKEDPGIPKGSSGQHGGLVCEGTPREDPGMPRGSSRQHGGLCLRGHEGRIPGCPRGPPDSMGACV